VHFSDKNQCIDACNYVNFGKVPNPFDFQRLATEDARKSRHVEAPQKLYIIARYIYSIIVDDLLLTSFDLVRLPRFQVG
jgi:hypothetical protein